MRRKLLKFATAVSLLLFVATVFVWATNVIYPDFTDAPATSGYVVGGRGESLFPANQTFDYWLPALCFSALPVAAAARWFRRREAEDVPCCHRCGYDLTGNVSGVCPECGTSIPQNAEAMKR